MKIEDTIKVVHEMLEYTANTVDNKVEIVVNDYGVHFVEHGLKEETIHIERVDSPSLLEDE